MTTEQSTSDTWGAPVRPSPPGRWSGKRIAIAVAVGIAGAGATAVYAASDSTELLQNGAVTAIRDTSVTVESEDGYTKTYTIDADTAAGNDADLSDIATGDDVTVTADESGTAATVVEAGQMGQARPGN